jgi:hypothetical protein
MLEQYSPYDRHIIGVSVNFENWVLNIEHWKFLIGI